MKKTPLIPTIIGTGLGSGFWPWGPGTAGSAAGLLVWILIFSFLDSSLVYPTMLFLIVLFTLLGTWATSRLMPYWGDDPSRVVIDEVVGVWIALLPAFPIQELWWTPAEAFLLFRFFDIVKPLGIRALDRRKGAFWVMADDILAGIYSSVLVLATEITFIILWGD